MMLDFVQMEGIVQVRDLLKKYVRRLMPLLPRLFSVVQNG